MNLKPRFHTETKESTSYPSTNYSNLGKFIPNSISDYDFLKKEQPLFKYLTIKVHEARLLVDVSLFGKMTTFSKFQIGSLNWKTSVDKESHMNPKWNESKTFEIKNLCKYLKELSKGFNQVSSLENLNNRKTTNAVNDNDPDIIIGIYDHAFLRDTLIGETRISLTDLVKKQTTSDWYMIRSKNEIVGSIHLTLKFEYSEDEVSTNFSHVEQFYGSKFSPSEYKVPTDTYHRVYTEPYESSKFHIYSKANFSNYKNTPSTYMSSRDNLQNTLSYQKVHSASDYRFPDFTSTQKTKSIQRLKTTSDQDGFKLYRRPPSGFPSKQKFEEREYETLITYENNNEESEAGTPADEKQFYENFFNTRSSDEKDIEKEDSDITDCDLNSDEGDEGDRVTKSDDCLTDTSEALELQKILAKIKRENSEVRTKEAELKNKFETIKLEFEKVSKEREALESKKNDLNTREECLRNERKNLSEDFSKLRKQEIEIQDQEEKLRELRIILQETKIEEKKERELTDHLEEQIRHFAVFYQRETQGLKHLEHEMYKRLIAEKIYEYGVEFEENQKNRTTVLDESIFNHKVTGEIQYEEDLKEAKNRLYERQYELDAEFQTRSKNIEKLRIILRDQAEGFDQRVLQMS